MSQRQPGRDVTVDVRRSARRRRTVSAYQEGRRIVVLIPASFTAAQEREWVDTMVGRIQAKVSRRLPTDVALARRADDLSRRYLGGRAIPSSVRWVNNQSARWGSCTVVEGSIRLSHRLRGLPPWVIDYVLLHELAHLIEPSHSARFWSLLRGYPRLERARGFLDGYAAAAGLDIGSPDDAADVEEEEDDDAERPGA